MNNFIIDIIRFGVGSVLIVLALRAYLKTRISAMLFLTLGFTLLTIGHLFADIYFFENIEKGRLLSEIFDILGLIALIIAVKKS